MATQTTIIEFYLHDIYDYFIIIGEEPTAGLENAKILEELVLKMPQLDRIIKCAFFQSSGGNEKFDIVYKNKVESNEILLVFQIVEGKKICTNQGWYKIVRSCKV